MISIEIKAPYLIFVGSEKNVGMAKTGAGLIQWRPELCKGQFSLIDGCVNLGIEEMSISQAANAGVKSLLIGTASVGGGIPNEWLSVFEEALKAGLDIVGGVHTRLNDIPQLKAVAEETGSNLIDVRVPPTDLPVGNGKKRSGKRLLMVGTDCAVGKKYTALAIEKEMKKAGFNVDFRASGQTGIMIAGKGVPIDAVVGDFLSGAAEILSPENDDDHWDVIEGQGSIFHPGYSSVSMGLLMGSQPDAFIVCHEANRTRIGEWEHFPVPSIQEVIDRTIIIGSQTNPDIKCVGVSVNTSILNPEERENYLANLSKKLGLPCVDPLIDGTSVIIENLN